MLIFQRPCKSFGGGALTDMDLSSSKVRFPFTYVGVSYWYLTFLLQNCQKFERSSTHVSLPFTNSGGFTPFAYSETLKTSQKTPRKKVANTLSKILLSLYSACILLLELTREFCNSNLINFRVCFD
jgi:hypothetical protein